MPLHSPIFPSLKFQLQIELVMICHLFLYMPPRSQQILAISFNQSLNSNCIGGFTSHTVSYYAGLCDFPSSGLPAAHAPNITLGTQGWLQNSGSQPGAILSYRRQLTRSGNIFSCHNREAAKVRNAIKHPEMHKTAPHNK